MSIQNLATENFINVDFTAKQFCNSPYFVFLSIANFILESLIEICLLCILSPCLLKSALGRCKCSFVQEMAVSLPMLSSSSSFLVLLHLFFKPLQFIYFFKVC